MDEYRLVVPDRQITPDEPADAIRHDQVYFDAWGIVSERVDDDTVTTLKFRVDTAKGTVNSVRVDTEGVVVVEVVQTPAWER